MSFFFNYENDAFPSFDQMMEPTLLALSQLNGSAAVKDIDEKAIELMRIPDNMRTVPHKDSVNRTEISYRLAWARTYLKKYGLIKNEPRGIWSLTNKYNENIKEIDAASIVRTVKKEISADTDDHLFSGIGSAQAFENLVLSTLRDRALNQGKPISSKYVDAACFGYDVNFPEGIDELNGQVCCIIKYLQSNNRNIFPVIENSLLKLNDKLQDVTLLFILNITLSNDENEKLIAAIHGKTGFNAFIWDNEALSRRVDPESDSVRYIINPKQALIEDVLSDDLTSEKWKEEQQNKQKEFISKVKAAFRNQDIILFLGAGVSIDAGIPLWTGLIKQLLIYMINSKTRANALTETELKLLNELAYNNKEDSPLTQMRYIKSAFSDEEYYTIVHDVLYSKPLYTNTTLLNAIAKISIPQRSFNGIKSIVTYNFDDLLECKFKEKEIEYNTVCCENDMTSINKLNIHHVHGYLPKNPDIPNDKPDLIFSEEDYHRVYRDSYSWSNLMQLNAFRDSTCLFIGCSLTDPNLRRLLDVAARSGESPRHYAFLQRKSIYSKEQHAELLSLYQRIDDNIREGYFRDLGLNIIWVDDHKEIPGILLEFLQ
jgi:hypothetical protein